MDTWSTGRAGRLLGVSTPAVHAAIRRLGLTPDHTAGGHVRLRADEVRALVDDLGAVPRVPGLRRSQVLVLAALSRAPLGLRSARAASRATGLSPTTAARALASLRALGLVAADERMLAEGTAVRATVWRLDATDPRWLAMAPTVARAVLPASPPPNRAAALPHRFWHLFWNVDPGTLDIAGRDAGFVATRLVLSRDTQAVAWALSHLDADALRHAAANRGADARARAMIRNSLVAREARAA